MNYYYFGASLPMLSLEAAPAVSVQEFRRLCREHLQPEDAAAIEALFQEGDPRGAGGGHAPGSLAPGAGGRTPSGPRPGRPGQRFLAEWRNVETLLRNAAARQRASRSRRDAGPSLREARGVDLSIEKAVTDAFAKKLPSERELALDRLRFRLAEDLAGREPFSIRAILSYAVRLRMAERWAAMDAAEGRARVEGILSAQTAGPAGPASERGRGA